MRPLAQRIPAFTAAILELIDEVVDARDPDSPGGAEVTAAEGFQITLKMTPKLLALVVGLPSRTPTERIAARGLMAARRVTIGG